MADFAYYRDVYLGSRIPEEDFPGLMERAKAVLARYRRIYRVADSGPDAENLALCAMAEALYDQLRRKAGVSYASVGGVSVRYDNNPHKDHALMDAARLYLDISRAV